MSSIYTNENIDEHSHTLLYSIYDSIMDLVYSLALSIWRDGKINHHTIEDVFVETVYVGVNIHVQQFNDQSLFCKTSCNNFYIGDNEFDPRPRNKKG